jgi:cytoskeletal protein CcmA (bactofilin family)
MNRKASDGSGIHCECVVGSDTKISGNLSGSEDILINGEVDGDIDINASVYVGENGKVTGKITATDVLIEGKVDGFLKAMNKIQLASTANIAADMECRNLEVSDGAFFEGKVNMEGV